MINIKVGTKLIAIYDIDDLKKGDTYTIMNVGGNYIHYKDIKNNKSKRFCPMDSIKSYFKLGKITNWRKRIQ